jgi:CheY-like chemotaxis protein
VDLQPLVSDDEISPSADAFAVETQRKSDRVHPLIMIVDDDPGLRETLANVLRDERYVVATAADGREALELLGRGLRPTAILLDLWMPTLDGAGTLRAMRDDARLAGTPVIIITASGDPVDADLKGASSFVMRKPLNLDRLLFAIELHRLRA